MAVDGWAGLVFDHYTADDFKFVALDVAAGAVVIGHRLGATWFTDATFAIPLVAGEGLLMAELSGASVNVYFAGALLGAFSYNGPLLDGALGLVVRSGAATFDDVRLFVGTHFINAVDNVPPVLTVPPDVTVWAESGQTSVIVSDATIGSATATDNVPGVVVEPSGVPSDNYFPIGVTAITWTATDVFGNETIGTQLVTVLVPLPAVNVKATDSSGAEQGANPIVFTVARSLALGTVTVGLAWSGTATFGDDYSVTATGGTLSANGTALTLADGVASVTVTVMPVDDGIIESAETVVLGVVAGTGYSVGSPSSASGSIADNDAFPVVSVSAGDAAGAEPADPITFTVTRTSDLTAPVVINLVWSGTAVFGVDYTVTSAGGTLSTNGTQLVLAAGVASEAITVTPINDANIEDTEDVVLAVDTGAGYLVGSPSSASGSIADDDVASGPVISVTASDALGSEPADSITFTITRTGDVTATVTINLGWSGTATYGVDYTVTASEGTFTGSTLMLAGGTTSVTFTVTPIEDAVVESAEGVILTVLTGAGYVLGSTSTASGTIDDNDTLPVVGVVPLDLAGSETGPDVITFTITRTGNPSAPLVIGFGWFGTAKLGKDFTASVSAGGVLSKTTVTLAAGVSSVTITITPLDDATIEALETVIFTLKSGAAYTLGSPASATGTIADNDGKVASSTSVAPTSLVEPTTAEGTSIEPVSTDVAGVDSDVPTKPTGRSKFDMLAV